jgi:hypothetical protein
LKGTVSLKKRNRQKIKRELSEREIEKENVHRADRKRQGRQREKEVTKERREKGKNKKYLDNPQDGQHGPELVVTQTNGWRPAHSTRRDVSLVCITVHKTQCRETLKIIAYVPADIPCTYYVKQ